MKKMAIFIFTCVCVFYHRADVDLYELIKQRNGGDLQLVTNVDDQSIGLGIDSYPVAILEDLQARDGGVLEKNGEGIGIGVRRQAISQLRLRAPGVVVDRHVLIWLPENLH